MPYSDGVYTPPTGAENAVPGQVIRSAIWNTIHTDISAALTDVGSVAIEYVIDGGGQPVLAGAKGFLEIPFPCTINGWKIMADQSGSCVLDVWMLPFASFPPTNANSITGSAQPSLTSQQSNSSTTLTGWTTSILLGNILAFDVISNSTCTRLTLSLDCGRN